MTLEPTTAMHYEAQCSTQLLRRCPHCGDRHPLAYQPPRRADRCPSCGMVRVIEAEPVITTPAVVIDPTLRRGQWLCRLGVWLIRFAKRL